MASFATLNLFPPFFAPSQTDSPDSADAEDDAPGGEPGQDDVDELAGGEMNEREAIRTLGSLKRSRTGDDASPSTSTLPSPAPPAPAGLGGPPVKVRKTRGSKACQGCRKIKAKCVGSAHPPCERCTAAGQECIFTASRRGKRNPDKMTTGQLATSLSRIEATFSTAFAALSSPEVIASSAGQLVHPIRQESIPIASPADAEVAAAPVVASTIAAGPDHPDQLTPAVGRDADHGPKLHSLPSSSLNPLGLLAEASRQNTKYSMSLESILESSEMVNPEVDGRVLGQGRLGLSNKSYFQPNPMNILPLRGLIFNQRVPSKILTSKLLSTEEVAELFELYFSHLHPHYAVLSPDLHTPTTTSLRSPFLFSCICAVASRFYKKREDDLYRKCLGVTKSASANLLANGWKSPEVVQGFLLLSHWNQPAETYEQELTYQFSGMAIRMATDLNLQRRSTVSLPENVSAEARARFNQEVLNRERVWLHCVITDRSISTQMGKPSMIAREDPIVRSARNWSKQPGTQESDTAVCAIVEMHRIVGRILTVLHSDSAGVPKNLDYPSLTDMFLGLLETWHDDWLSPNMTVGSTLREFYYWYYRLFVLSFAVQHALDDPTSGIDMPGYCLMCCQAIKEIIDVSQSLLDQGILGYATDTTFTCLSYAGVFLLKLVSPTFSKIIAEKRVFAQVTQVADILGKCAADPTHTPALYALFIRALLQNRKEPNASAPPSRMQTRAGTPSTPPAVPEYGHILEPWSEAFGMVGASMEDTPAQLGLPEDLNDFAVNSLMSNNDFWQTMLMPGFGGPLVGLAGGNGLMFSGEATDFQTPFPMFSRPPSPHPGDLPFDFMADH